MFYILKDIFYTVYIYIILYTITCAAVPLAAGLVAGSLECADLQQTCENLPAAMELSLYMAGSNRCYEDLEPHFKKYLLEMFFPLFSVMLNYLKSIFPKRNWRLECSVAIPRIALVVDYKKYATL